MDKCQLCGGWCCWHYEDEFKNIKPVMCGSFDPKTKRCVNYDVRPWGCRIYPLRADKHHPCALYKEKYDDSRIG